MNKTKLTGATDTEIKSLLRQYECPTPFHEVRTRFLGTIASPGLAVSPLGAIKELWGTELPEFESEEAVNELFNGLIAGLWNRLSAHQSGLNPFKLLRFEVAPTRDSIKSFALHRQQELDGFVIGLFGPNEKVDLPESVQAALGALADTRSMLVAIITLLGDPSKPADSTSLQEFLRNLHKMTIIAENAINKINLASQRARRQSIELMPATRPTLH